MNIVIKYKFNLELLLLMFLLWLILLNNICFTCCDVKEVFQIVKRSVIDPIFFNNNSVSDQVSDPVIT